MLDSLFDSSLFLVLGSFVKSLLDGICLLTSLGFGHFLHIVFNALGSFSFLGGNSHFESCSSCSLDRLLGSVIQLALVKAVVDGYGLYLGVRPR